MPLSPEQIAERNARLAVARQKQQTQRAEAKPAADGYISPGEGAVEDVAEDIAEEDAAGPAVAEPDADGAEIAEPIGAAPDEAAERRKRLLGDMDEETAALFSDDELAGIEAEERDKALADAKKLALSGVRAAARQRARIEHDLIPADTLRSQAEKKRLAEMVTFRVTLPGDGAGHRGQNGFRVDGRLYQAGREYTLPRAQYESLVANHYRAWLAEVQFRTLDQHKAGNSAVEILHNTIPRFEVRNAA